jgi:colanic acid/amylovoran biosynthesis glycosyltransferase
MVLLESQLSGMPVLATQHNGFTDAVDDGRSGFLVPEKDVDALYEKLNWLLENPASWEAMGKAGREHVLKNFSEDVYMRKILDKLNSLLFSF